MAVNINVPSQVKTYANLAAFPATGALKTIYIAEDTNKTYRWTGSVYTEISASAAMTWGAIGGTLSNQTDLQNALDAKQDDITLTTTGSSGASTLVGSTLNVPNYTLSGLGGVPTSRTLTINGVTQDLSANRTFTISTGITIGSTAIASGVVGRVLFEGAGNVVQESSSLFWDNTNARLGIGTSTPLQTLNVQGRSLFTRDAGVTAANHAIAEFYRFSSGAGNAGFGVFYEANGTDPIRTYLYAPGGLDFQIRTFKSSTGTAETNINCFAATTNVGINTTTDAGFRLDVNGTARVQTSLAVTTGKTFSAYQSSQPNDALKLEMSNLGVCLGLQNSNASGFSGIEYLNQSGAARVFTGFNNSNGQEFRFNNIATGGYIDFLIGGTSGLRIANTRNILINTTTDAGFRLDVNGTSRFQGAITCGEVNLSGSQLFTNKTTAPNSYLFSASSITILNGNNIRLSGGPVCVNESGANATASSVLDVSSTTKGFLPPRMTTTQKNAIASPAAGLVVYDTTLNKLCVYTTAWETVTSL